MIWKLMPHLEDILDGNAIRASLSGWEQLSDNDQTNKLDRVVVYATIHMDQK
jgi:hypothetical protein